MDRISKNLLILLALLSVLVACEKTPQAPDNRPRAVQQGSQVVLHDKQVGDVYILPTGERVLVVTRWWDQGGSPNQVGVCVSTTLLPPLAPPTVEAK